MSVLARLKMWARALRRDVLAPWLAARDRRTPWAARLLAAVVAAYALSPFDLIPDFMPVLGYLDDLLLVPAGIWMTVRLIPAPLMAELRSKAATHKWPVSLAGAVAVGVIWIGLVGLLVWSWSG